MCRYGANCGHIKRRLKEMGLQTYIDFQRSTGWKKTRRRLVGKESIGICRGCLKPGRVELHHLTYERLGNELDSDLLPLCRKCHGLLHKKLRHEYPHYCVEEHAALTGVWFQRIFGKSLSEPSKSANAARQKGPRCGHWHVKPPPAKKIRKKDIEQLFGKKRITSHRKFNSKRQLMMDSHLSEAIELGVVEPGTTAMTVAKYDALRALQRQRQIAASKETRSAVAV